MPRDTVSVDARAGTTTGISAADRATTIQALIDPATRPTDLVRPGHIFPLRYREGGVLKRAGHTEAAVDLARLAGLQPAGVICEVLSVPLEAIPRFHDWLEAALDGLDFGPEANDPEQQRRAAAVPAIFDEFRQFLVDLIDQYRKQPGPGMLSGMVNDDGPEGRLSQQSLVNNALLMLFAGHETTVNLIAHSVLTLLRHPDQLEKLRRRPELIVPAVEEILRFESSVQLWPTRSALEDIEIAGTTIPKGAPIFVVYGSANRDPERFENPDELDLERPNNEHVGYSQGIHYCFGAPLARLEAQTAVSEFFRRVENPRLVEDPPPYRRNHLFRGPRHLLVDIDGVRD